MSESRVKVLFIGGYGRSGSTLLERVLGQAPGFFSAGELFHVFRRSYVKNQLCGCNRPFLDCDFWNQVTDDAFGRSDALDLAEIDRLEKSVDRLEKTLYLALPELAPSDFKADLRAFGLILERFYRAIAAVSGCRVIVDSSKYPTHAFVLRSVSAIDLYALHLVRDPRAVAWSWKRKRVRPEIQGGSTLMPRYSLLQSAAEWNIANFLMRVLRVEKGHYLRVSYEQFVVSFREHMRRILAWVGEDPDALRLLSDTSINLSPNHTVSGNPMRFLTGPLEVRADAEWRSVMPARQKFAVTALTLPGLLRYGYLRGGRP